MKIEIPVSVQECLKCSNCNELLSCGPVFLINETSEAICGRCSIQPQEICNRTRNIQYEAAAKLLFFPCSFADRGCLSKLEFSPEEPNVHELDCEFRPLICPIVDRGSCDWIGTPRNLTEHCRDTHPSHLLENNSCVPKPDLTKSHLINYLIMAFNILFLLQFKVCVSTGKLYHSIRMIGDSKLLGNFSYYLEIEGNAKKLTEGGSILPRGILMLQQPTSICVGINSLLNFLRGKYNDATFTIKINCLKTFETMFCEEYKEKLVKCKFNAKGCSFVDLNKSKCEKHENRFCKYQTECSYCKMNFVGVSFIEHLDSSISSHKSIKSNINSVVRLTKTTNISNFIIFSSNNVGTIICSYYLSNSFLSLCLFSSLPWHQLKDFKCLVELTDPQTKQTKPLTPQIIDNNNYDWYIGEQMNTFSSWQNIGLDLKLKINK